MPTTNASDKEPVLTIRQTQRVFGCSHMSILHWTERSVAGRTKFPAKRTPSKIEAWAAKNEMKLAVKPLAAIKADEKERASARSTPAPKAKPAVKRNAAGKLSSARPQARKAAKTSDKS